MIQKATGKYERIYIYSFDPDTQALLECEGVILGNSRASIYAKYIEEDGSIGKCKVSATEGNVFRDRVWFREKKDIGEVCRTFLKDYEEDVSEYNRKLIHKKERLEALNGFCKNLEQASGE
jgi:hypothetical protein